METLRNGSRPTSVGSEIGVSTKPKRRRVSVGEKSRILRKADACASDTIGAFLRRQGIYSSRLCSWRCKRDRGDLDAPTPIARENTRVEVANSSAAIISSKSRTQGAVQDCMLRAHRGHLKRRSGSYHRVREPQVRRRERLIYVALTISATAPERAMRRARGSAARRLAAGGSERWSSHCAPSRSGSDAMRSESPNVAAALELLNSERFADLAAPQIFAKLLDDGTYLCSLSTMYRRLRANDQAR